MNKLTPQAISLEDEILIIKAKQDMNNESYLMKGFNFIGGKIEDGVELLPAKVQSFVFDKTTSILEQVVLVNLKTMKKGKPFKKPSKVVYKTLVTTTGAASGFLGAGTPVVGQAAFAADLALTTKFIMRSIMDIARGKGEDLHTIEAQVQCLQVLALGGESADDDGADTSYYASRIAIQSSINKASEVGVQGLLKSLSSSSNPLYAPLASIVARFSSKVSEKVAAQLIPVVGGLTGGAINYTFISHFQKMAEAHFTIRMLERKYGMAIVQERYNAIEI
ncbi:hypothetical protein SCB49_08933 [unidentified eubacterium SCB49]|nr:hypothetical protein SCB49_08933 [unidentified eubacterium SCB49]